MGGSFFFCSPRLTMELRISFVVVLVVGIAAMVGVVGGQDTQDTTSETGIVDQPTTPIERGDQKIGEKCNEDRNCSMEGGICDPVTKVCRCHPEYPASNHKDSCSKPVPINETCSYDDQCATHTQETVCRDNRCKCQFERLPIMRPDGVIECKAETKPIDPPLTVDPAMIGVLVGMALMFVIICVVLRLFSRARWRENRTIFNTPNPRLMNVSLLRDSKLLHSAEGRRGSRGSMRAPSRQPSMASLRPQSPTQAGGQPTASSRRGSRASNASPSSNRSNRSPTKPKGPEALSESVTIEVPQHMDKA